MPALSQASTMPYKGLICEPLLSSVMLNSDDLCVSIRDLALHRGGRSLHASLTLNVYKGQAFRVMGSNGCGKTTLLQTIAKVLSPRELFNDEPISSGACTVLCDVLYLPQELALIPHATVLHNLMFFGEVSKRQKGAFSLFEILEKNDPFQVLPLMSRKVEHLSHGQKRRVSLSRLFLSDAPLWLLDEPEQGLDASFLDILMHCIQAHCAQGGACLVATHGLSPYEHGVF